MLINTFVPRPWQDGDNEVIAAAARAYANVVLANWHAAIEHHTDLLWDDDVHPRPSGAPLYARTVAAAVQSTGISRRPLRPGRSRCHVIPLAHSGRPAAGPRPGRRQPAGGLAGEVEAVSAEQGAAPPRGQMPYEQARDELIEVVKRLEAGA